MTTKKTAKKATSIKKKAAKKAPVRKKTTSTKHKTTTKKASKKTTTKKKMAKVTKLKTGNAPQTDIKPYKARRGEDYMNTAQIAHFREILLSWKGVLMQEVERTVQHMQDDAANFPDPSDRATQEEEFALELRTRDRERKLIRKIDESITDLDSGDYGFCEVCGIEIGIRRLEARPTATLCIDCKTLDEIKECHIG